MKISKTSGFPFLIFTALKNICPKKAEISNGLLYSYSTVLAGITKALGAVSGVCLFG